MSTTPTGAGSDKTAYTINLKHKINLCHHDTREGQA